VSPTQQQRSEQTTSSLVDGARELFAADGYAATSLDAVVERAGVTKGALYHHFTGKRELFAAVFAAEQERLLQQLAAAAAGHDDPWDAFVAGCVAFVEVCQEPGLQRIFLLDAQVALGWERVRELESRSLELMVAGIERAVEAGRLHSAEPRQLAHLLFGAICETAMVVARQPDQRRALRESVAELSSMLTALATSP
jgi:AcrR family transcriptional regulator